MSRHYDNKRKYRNSETAHEPDTEPQNKKRTGIADAFVTKGRRVFIIAEGRTK